MEEAPKSEALSPTEFRALYPLPDWRVLVNRIETVVRAGSFAAAAELVARIATLADEADHHPDVNLRYPDIVHVSVSSHDVGGLTGRDNRLALAISALVADLDLRCEPGTSQRVEVAIDTVDARSIVPFWAAVLGYRPLAADATDDQFANLVDPGGTGPTFWFQTMTEARPQRSTFHIDVIVAPEAAEGRLQAAIAAGGRLVDDSFAPSWWVLADAEGNEACVCTCLGRT